MLHLCFAVSNSVNVTLLDIFQHDSMHALSTSESMKILKEAKD